VRTFTPFKIVTCMKITLFNIWLHLSLLTFRGHIVTVPSRLYVAVPLCWLPLPYLRCRNSTYGLLDLRVVGRGRAEIRLRALTGLHSATHHQRQGYTIYTLFLIFTCTIHRIELLHGVLRAHNHKLNALELYLTLGRRAQVNRQWNVEAHSFCFV
jgi:hypothetical protein